MSDLVKTRYPGIFKRVGITKVSYVATARVGLSQRKHSCDTLGEARAWRADTLAAAKGGTYVEPSVRTVGELLSEVWEADRGSVLESSHLAYASRIKQLHAFHDIPVQRLDAKTIIAWQAKALGGGKPYKKGTVAAALRYLRKALTHAVRVRLITVNPMAGMEIVAGEMSQDNVLTSAELARMRAAWADDPLRVFWEFLLETGARVGEARVVLLADLDLDAGVWHMRRRLTRTSAGMVSRDGAKTRSGMRDVRLTDELVALLRAHVQAMQDRRRFEPLYNAGDALFPGPKGTGFVRRATIDVSLTALCETAKVPRITPHGLRHTSATEAMAAGINPKVVAERIGHRDIATTLRRYVHPDSDEHERAVKVLGKRLKLG